MKCTLTSTSITPFLALGTMFADVAWDMQPQRPPRTLRVYGDENAVPCTGIQKTIHQRNKSSPALSTLVTKASKRTAFGDVSNTANVARPSKDDLILNGKSKSKPTEKPVLFLDEKKTASFQRPAQRPPSVSGHKSQLGGVSNTREPITKQPFAEIQRNIQPVAQTANSRNLTTKKSTAVIKDVATTQSEQAVTDVAKFPSSTAPMPPVHRELPAPRTSDKSQDIVEPQLRRTPSDYVDALEVAPSVPVSMKDIIQSSTLEEAPIARSDGVYIDGDGAVQVYEFDNLAEYPEETVELAGTKVPDPAKNNESTSLAALDLLLNIQPAQATSAATGKNALPPVSEPEEYWEEDAVENCDEEGYVTARSFKSRTDNTTGNATTVLFPKATQKTKREISAAKELIEGSKTAEEREDEAWDTTMVAEYGDEIFGYMKDLEVCLAYVLSESVIAEMSTDQNVAQRPLYGQSSRDSMVDAGCTYGLDRPSSPPFQPSS